LSGTRHGDGSSVVILVTWMFVTTDKAYFISSENETGVNFIKKLIPEFYGFLVMSSWLQK